MASPLPFGLRMTPVPSSACTASSSRSHSFSVIGAVAGTMMSTTPLAMFVMDGGVARVRLRMVGWMENGLTPLLNPMSSDGKRKRVQTHRMAWAGSAETLSLTWTADLTGGLG